MSDRSDERKKQLTHKDVLESGSFSPSARISIYPTYRSTMLANFWSWSWFIWTFFQQFTWKGHLATRQGLKIKTPNVTTYMFTAETFPAVCNKTTVSCVLACSVMTWSGPDTLCNVNDLLLPLWPGTTATLTSCVALDERRFLMQRPCKLNNLQQF